MGGDWQAFYQYGLLGSGSALPKNKEFIFSLFPSGKIYTTFLSAEARNSIGKVGKETEPVVHMLKKIGFQYKNQIDPFDGGPHFWASVDEILPIKKLASYALAAGELGSSATAMAGLVCRPDQKPGEFRAIAAQVCILDGKLGIVEPKEEVARQVLGLSVGEPISFMPYY